MPPGRCPKFRSSWPGTGPSGKAWKLSAPASVTFVGQRTVEELQLLRADAVAILSPSSWYENAPITVLEAMRDGRPVIVSSLGGQPELVEGGAGLAVRPRDPGALASAIRRIWRDRPLAAEMGRASRNRLLASYTLDRHVTRARRHLPRSDGRRCRASLIDPPDRPGGGPIGVGPAARGGWYSWAVGATQDDPGGRKGSVARPPRSLALTYDVTRLRHWTSELGH